MRRLVSLLASLVLLLAVTPAHAVVGNLQFHCPPYADPANPAQKYMRAVDPLVSFGINPSEHVHQFAGNMGPDGAGITSTTKMADLLKPGNPSSCFVKANRSALWWPPVILLDGTLVGATNFRYYFRNPGGPKMMFPSGGFKQVIGNHDNDNDYGSPARWQCLPSGTIQLWMPHETSPGCSGNASLELTIRDGATCWDGNRTGPGMGGDDGPANGRSHKEPCDAAHPYRLPVIDMVIDFPHAALTTGSRLTCDDPMVRPGLCAHVDDVELFAPQDPVSGLEPQGRILNMCMNQIAGPGSLPDNYPPMDPNGLSCQEVDDLATGTGTVWVTTRNVPLSQAGPNTSIPAVVH